MSQRILLIEDDAQVSMLLQSDLELEGFTVQVMKDGQEGLEAVKRFKPDLLILDVMLPSLSGYDVCRSLRKQGCQTPIMMLTAKGQETEKVIGLDLGADDYMTKPFSGMELMARVKALLRRGRNLNAAVSLQIDDLSIDLKGMEVKKAGKPLALTRREFQLLELLLRHRGEVVSREKFLEEIWGYDEEQPQTRTVDTQMATLRQKLAGKNRNPDHYIRTLHGSGYKFTL